MEDGRFPFGRPSTAREPRRPTSAAAAIAIGAYPSAFHVRWWVPRWAHNLTARTWVRNLAVDVEPAVFWDGRNPSATALFTRWKSIVDFRSGDDDGAWGRVEVGDNGPSGDELYDRLLDPLGVGADEIWLTDVVDRYLVHRKGPRSQGFALDEVFAPFATAAGLAAADLPTRPSPATLIKRAVTDHRSRLRAEVVASGAPLVISLGEEARAAVARIADRVEGSPTRPLALAQMNELVYGKPGAIDINGISAEWMAIIHPYQSHPEWLRLHAGWIARMSRKR